MQIPTIIAVAVIKPYFFEISFIDILLDDIDSDRWLTCSECFDYRTLKCKNQVVQYNLLLLRRKVCDSTERFLN